MFSRFSRERVNVLEIVSFKKITIEIVVASKLLMNDFFGLLNSKYLRHGDSERLCYVYENLRSTSTD